MPPATFTISPEHIPEATGEASHTIAAATSSGVASLFSGLVAVARSAAAGSGAAPPVSVQPGATTLTRPSGAMRTISFFSVRANP
ncbi:UNVERIFIED_CONTAM: hypothetical protein QYM44_02945 [Kocuria sp. CPCC 205315]